MPSGGQQAKRAKVIVDVEVLNTATTATDITVAVALFDADGQPSGTAELANPMSLPAASSSSAPSSVLTGTITLDVTGGAVQLWSVARPYLYTLQVTLSSGDSRNTSIGIHTTAWTGDRGLFMNEEHIKVRGFCSHESFGGVGMAIPDRVNLFRAQALRSVGGNGWRMSHNPVTPGLYDILDRVGVVAMDETRILGSDAVSVMNMGAMVKRDRNHASVIIWSYCNEQGCGNGTGSMGPEGSGDTEGAQDFHTITMRYDKSRATLGNMPNFAPNSTSVAGFSEGTSGGKFDYYNSQHPTRPKFASECCNCHSDRDERVDRHDIISCAASKSNPSDSRDFVVGTMVWTLFDYYGVSQSTPRRAIINQSEHTHIFPPTLFCEKYHYFR